MQFAKLLAIVTIFAGGALAAPNKPKPPPPPPSPTPVQTNACGNGATPYCCNTDTSGSSGTPYGYSSCYAYQFSNQCGATTVCCNAQNSVQTCIGNTEVITPPYYPYY